ncbi:MAG: hypothetical protein HUU31_14580 [Anaerolineae bacterium]|nr:hypothetical protein [Anaerolineae bacterium]
MLNLRDLIQPNSIDVFLDTYWQQQELIVKRNAVDYYRDLLTLTDIDTLLTTTEPLEGHFRIVKDGEQLEPKDYTSSITWGNRTSSRVIDVRKAIKYYSEGATIVIEALNRRNKHLSVLCGSLEQELFARVQANVYLTPRNAQGFSRHYDTHDVFVLQIYGKKCWHLFDTPVGVPDESTPYHQRVGTGHMSSPTTSVVLESGDFLYIPRGMVHEASTSDETSLHVTLGIYTYTWFDFFQETLRICREDSRFRQSITLSDLKTRKMNEVSELLFETLAEQFIAIARDSSAILENISGRHIASRRAQFEGVLLNLESVPSLKPETLIRKRLNNPLDVIQTEEGVLISNGGLKITFDERFAAAAAFLLSCDEAFPIHVLPHLTWEDQLYFITTLINAGVISPE